jgi:hypothetical protein
MEKLFRKWAYLPEGGVPGFEILCLSSTLNTDSEYISINHKIDRYLVVQPKFL